MTVADARGPSAHPNANRPGGVAAPRLKMLSWTLTAGSHG